MRVVTGKARGRKLSVPAGRDVRPTSDRVREAVFSSLGERVPGARVLDLFAGSGALGIEALSRGATRAVFVEKTGAALSAVRSNLEVTGLEDLATVLARDAFAALRGLRRANERFDLVFLDPPYDAGLLERALDSIASGGLLAEGGAIVAEHRISLKIDAPRGLRTRTRKSYGGTAVTTFERDG